MNGMTYLQKRKSSGSSAVKIDQLVIFWDGTQDNSALGNTGLIELYDCFQLEDSGVYLLKIYYLMYKLLYLFFAE